MTEPQNVLEAARFSDEMGGDFNWGEVLEPSREKNGQTGLLLAVLDGKSKVVVGSQGRRASSGKPLFKGSGDQPAHSLQLDTAVQAVLRRSVDPILARATANGLRQGALLPFKNQGFSGHLLHVAYYSSVVAVHKELGVPLLKWMFREWARKRCNHLQ